MYYKIIYFALYLHLMIMLITNITRTSVACLCSCGKLTRTIMSDSTHLRSHTNQPSTALWRDWVSIFSHFLATYTLSLRRWSSFTFIGGWVNRFGRDLQKKRLFYFWRGVNTEHDIFSTFLKTLEHCRTFFFRLTTALMLDCRDFDPSVGIMIVGCRDIDWQFLLHLNCRDFELSVGIMIGGL